MIKSIRFKMTIVLILILGAVLLAELLINSVYAEKYYLHREGKALVDTYHEIEKIIDVDPDSPELYETVEELATDTNIKMIMFAINGDSFSVKGYGTNLRDESKMYEEMYNYLDNIFRYDSFRDWLFYEDEESKERLIESLSGSDDVRDRQIAELITKGYFVTDSQESEEFKKGLYLFGCSEGKYLLAMKIPLNDIRTSARISSNLLLRVGLSGILLGCLFMFFYASTFTKPIKEMARASEEMSKLNFDVKVPTDREDELGMLGQSINRMSSQLETAIAELKSANIQLQKDLEKKEEIDEMRKDFLSHVSHELKTPIALIQGYAEGLKDNINEDQESREFYCDVITDEARKMNDLVRKLLNLNQIEFGTNGLDLSRFDLSQMIENKLDSLKIMFEKKEIRLTYEPCESMYVWADELMIEEVFSNYISNAINHVPPGGSIRIWCQKTGDCLRVHVYNDGDNIPEEDLDKIWIKFYKVDKARTREYGGSGIGLSIVAATMEAHGKAFGVTNEPGGVDFYFDLDTEPGLSC